MTVVTSTELDAAGQPAGGVKVTAALQAKSAWLADRSAEIVRAEETESDAAGVWQLDLIPTDRYEDTGATYLVGVGSNNYRITVPASGGPYLLRDLLVAAPQSSPAVASYVETSTLAAPSGVATLDLAGLLAEAQRPAQEIRNYAIVSWDGMNATARRLSDSLILRSGSTPSEVIAAALDAAQTDGGGLLLVEPGAIPIPVDAPLRPYPMTGFAGGAVYNRHGNLLAGTLLVANGLGVDDAVIEIGTAGEGTEGVVLRGIAVDADNTACAVHGFNATDLIIDECYLIKGAQRIVWIESDLSPDFGGVATNIHECMIRTVGSGGTGLMVEGVGATDGILTDCRILNCTVGASLWGGWQVGLNHITGNASSTANLILPEPDCVVVGNYFDSAGSGANVVIGGHSTEFGKNRCYNHQGELPIGVDLNAERCEISGNLFRITGSTAAVKTGYGMQWQSPATTLPRGGYGPNYMTTDGLAGGCFVDSTGADMPDTIDDPNTFILGNRRD